MRGLLLKKTEIWKIETNIDILLNALLSQIILSANELGDRLKAKNCNIHFMVAS